MKLFRKKLARQICEYRPWHLTYPGDEFLRGTSKRTRTRRGGKRKAASKEIRVRGRVSYDQYVEARRDNTRFCNDDFEYLKGHLHCLVRKGHHCNCDHVQCAVYIFICTMREPHVPYYFPNLAKKLMTCQSCSNSINTRLHVQVPLSFCTTTSTKFGYATLKGFIHCHSRYWRIYIQFLFCQICSSNNYHNK